MDAFAIAQLIQSFSTDQSSDGRTTRAAQTPQPHNTRSNIGAWPPTRPALQPASVAQVSSINTLPVPFLTLGASATPTTSSTLPHPLAGLPHPPQWTSYSAAAKQSAPKKAKRASAKATSGQRHLVDDEDILENGDQPLTCLWECRACDLLDAPHTGECDASSPQCVRIACGVQKPGREMWAHILKAHYRDLRVKDTTAAAGTRVPCRWASGACSQRMQPGSVKKHVQALHLQLKRRCLYCATTQRKDAYLLYHGTAANCASNPHRQGSSTQTSPSPLPSSARAGSSRQPASTRSTSGSKSSSRSTPERTRHSPYGPAGSTFRQSSRAQGHLVDPTTRDFTATIPSIAKWRRGDQKSSPNQPTVSSSSSSFLPPFMDPGSPWDDVAPTPALKVQREPSPKFGVPPGFPWHGPYMPVPVNVGRPNTDVPLPIAVPCPGPQTQLYDVSASASIVSSATIVQGPAHAFIPDAAPCDPLAPSIPLDGTPSQTYALDFKDLMDWEGSVFASDPASNAAVDDGCAQFSPEEFDAFLATLAGLDSIPPSDAALWQAAPVLQDPFQIVDPLHVQAALPVQTPTSALVGAEGPGSAGAQVVSCWPSELLPEQAMEGEPEMDFSEFIAELEPDFSSW